MKTFTISSLLELENFAYSFLDTLIQKEHAIIVALSGDLGAGKTAFTKKCAEYFHVADTITSPTFVIQKEYEIKQHTFLKKMIHIDAYRLEGAAELEYLGWKDNINRSENIIFIEWPTQVSGVDMPNVISINIEINESEKRIITVNTDNI